MIDAVSWVAVVIVALWVVLKPGPDDELEPPEQPLDFTNHRRH